MDVNLKAIPDEILMDWFGRLVPDNAKRIRRKAHAQATAIFAELATRNAMRKADAAMKAKVFNLTDRAKKPSDDDLPRSASSP